MNAPRGQAALGPGRMFVDADTVLDARLSLYHRREKWLAVADLHFGYELSQRAAGAMFPLWGMETIETRLRALLADYRPEWLVIVGDFVHDRSARGPALDLLARLRIETEVILLAGNHDRRAFDITETRAFFTTDGFCFYHGDGPAPAEATGRREVIGHHHPAGILRDGAGLALKLPALVETGNRWVLPAFSPWAAGGAGGFGRGARRWMCGPRRVLGPSG